MQRDIFKLSVSDLGKQIRNGSLSSYRITEATLDRIRSVNGKVHAFTHVDRAGALAQAAQADAELASGVDRGPMHGIPFSVKDIIDVAGMATTCNSKLRVDHTADADASVVARFKAGGAVLVGKVVTWEFAMTLPEPGLPFPAARNPWNTEHVSGGSSSGSAASVAAGLVRVSIGSDTGGSIRVPAAWCGTVGLKPTYGRVSLRGVFPLAWSLDHCGPLAKSVEDAAIALQVMAGYDPLDDLSADEPVPDYLQNLEAGVEGLRIGVPRTFFETATGLSDDVRTAFERTVGLLRERDAVVENVELPDLELFVSTGKVIIAAEMHAMHRRAMQTRLTEYGKLSATRLMMGQAINSADYIDALRLRGRLVRAVNSVLERHDALMTVGPLTTAPRFDPAHRLRHWPLQLNMFNVTGHPALCVPAGLGSDALPLAVQLVGRTFDEATILRVGREIEKRSGWQDIEFPPQVSGA